MQIEAPRLAGDSSGQEEASSRVSVVVTGSPKPMRVVQHARLWAMRWTASKKTSVEERPWVDG